MLRPQQESLRILTTKISKGSLIKNIFLFWTPGGGKSIAPVILSDLLINNKKMVWIVPRDSLKSQGESDFINDIYPTDKTIRIASNTGDPFRGCDACVTTYQAIGANPEKWSNIFSEYNCMIVLDEYHHLSGHGEWIKPISKMVELSFLRVFMTGTINRGDDTELPFTKYINGKVDFRDSITTKWIIYSREQAIADKAILPFETTLVNGSGSYIDLDGITRSFDKFGESGDELRCAYKTQYAYNLLDLSISEWLEYKRIHEWSKMLVVAANIETANEYLDYIKIKYHIKTAIATSEDSKECRQNIKLFKLENKYSASIECLVTVAVAYEGLSVKPITHMSIMTLIRSTPWLEQCTGRSVRTYPEKDRGYIYAPEDPRMVRVLKSISSGEIKHATAEHPEPKTPKNPDAEPGTARQIEALESHAHIKKDFGTYTPKPIQEETQSEIEHRLRTEINVIINKVFGEEQSGNKNVKRKLFYLRIKQQVNKGRDENGRLIKKSFSEMTVKDLIKAKEIVDNYI